MTPSMSPVYTPPEGHVHHYRLPDQQVTLSTRKVLNALSGHYVTIKRWVVRNSNKGSCPCGYTRTFHPRYQYTEEEPLEEVTTE